MSYQATLSGYLRRADEALRPVLGAGLAGLGYFSKPAFLIIGAQKAGTTALYAYLAAHPSIIPALRKELQFFAHNVCYRKGMAFYHAHFPLPLRLKENAITFEASPDYLYFPCAPKRIFEYDPRLKLIVVLRDPVERAFSAWNMYRSRSRAGHRIPGGRFDRSTRVPLNRILAMKEFPSFEQTVREEIARLEAGSQELEPSFVRRGFYGEQLERVFRYFKRDQILVLDSRRLHSQTNEVLEQVLQFIGGPALSGPRQTWEKVLVGEYDLPMPDRTRTLLQEFYRGPNRHLYDLLNHDFGWQ
jgi:hypothetical protein